MAKRLPLTDSDGEVRELTAEDFNHFKTAPEVLPTELLDVLPKRGRPRSEAPKQAVNIRLAPDIIVSRKNLVSRTASCYLHEMNAALPIHTDESPTAYADRVGVWYASRTSDTHKSEHGQYLTPKAVARFMAGLFDGIDSVARILDPGAGSGILSCAACEALATVRGLQRIELVAYEAEAGLSALLDDVLKNLRQWLHARGVEFSFEVRCDDFILSKAACIKTRQHTLFTKGGETFDFIISNPPISRSRRPIREPLRQPTLCMANPIFMLCSWR